jgi:hypothetical protein
VLVPVPDPVPLPPNASTERSTGCRNDGSRLRLPFSIDPTPTTGAIRLAPPLASIVPGWL